MHTPRCYRRENSLAAPEPGAPTAKTAQTTPGAQNLPRADVIEDISYATQYIRQTADAAEIYFDMSEGKKKLREELTELEQALLSSREAAASFEEVVGSENAELRTLNVQVERLKTVTDNFGKRVRDQAAAEMAARRKENS